MSSKKKKKSSTELSSIYNLASVVSLPTIAAELSGNLKCCSAMSYSVAICSVASCTVAFIMLSPAITTELPHASQRCDHHVTFAITPEFMGTLQCHLKISLNVRQTSVRLLFNFHLMSVQHLLNFHPSCRPAVLSFCRFVVLSFCHSI